MALWLDVIFIYKTELENIDKSLLFSFPFTVFESIFCTIDEATCLSSPGNGNIYVLKCWSQEVLQSRFLRKAC